MKYVDVFTYWMSSINLPATILLTLLGTFITIIVTLINILLKTNKQKALLKMETIESQINLTKMFIELISIVGGRQKTEISKEFITGIISKVSSVENEKEMKEAIKYINDNAYIFQPIGVASQKAIASAIFNFGINNDILLEPALIGLKNLANVLNQNSTNVSHESPDIIENLNMLESKLNKIKQKQKQKGKLIPVWKNLFNL